jgi:hypothetical protein
MSLDVLENFRLLAADRWAVSYQVADELWMRVVWAYAMSFRGRWVDSAGVSTINRSEPGNLLHLPVRSGASAGDALAFGDQVGGGRNSQGSAATVELGARLVRVVMSVTDFGDPSLTNSFSAIPFSSARSRGADHVHLVRRAATSAWKMGAPIPRRCARVKFAMAMMGFLPLLLLLRQVDLQYVILLWCAIFDFANGTRPA